MELGKGLPALGGGGGHRAAEDGEEVVAAHGGRPVALGFKDDRVEFVDPGSGPGVLDQGLV